jgi:hypothetical protein
VDSYTFHYYQGGHQANRPRAGSPMLPPLSYRFLFGDASKRGGVIGQVKTSENRAT